MAAALAVGKVVAERAIKNQIKQVVFDRNGFVYHGRIRAVAEGARMGGLDF
jgi:large subunit ribosomal protein L18